MKEANIVLNGKFIDPIEGYKLNEAFNVAEQLRQYVEMMRVPHKRPDYDFSKFDEDEEEGEEPVQKPKSRASKSEKTVEKDDEKQAAPQSDQVPYVDENSDNQKAQNKKEQTVQEEQNTESNTATKTEL